MIQVEHLTKRFGDVRAIDDVTFEVGKGEIMGFLGPNGAGKTTTMRILAGFFPASAGRARVAGFDVFEQSLEAKRRVGYLPENPPLYPEMSVDDFLRFAGTIKGVVSAELTSRMEGVKEKCGLVDWGHRLIKHLSKGYRQRVGLAQALIHDPEVLILDEPTVGLDPKQIIEVRELIRGLGGNHTIILSTHILPEVSMTCEQVIIIKEGRIAAKDTPQNLTSQLRGVDQIMLQVRAPRADGQLTALEMRLNRLDAVRQITLSEKQNDIQSLVVEVEGQQDLRPEIARQVLESGLDLYELKRRTMTLEEIFLELTTEEEAAEPETADENAEAPLEHDLSEAENPSEKEVG